MALSTQGTNNNIILTNAYCCISKQAAKVSKLLSIGDRCAQKEVAKLKLLIDYVEALKCYNTETTNSKFLVRVTSVDYENSFLAISNPLRTYRITVNGVQYTQQGDGVSTRGEIFISILNTINNIISYYVEADYTKEREGYNYVYIEAECDVTSIIFDTTVSTSPTNFTNIIPGNCKVENCLSEDNFDIIKSRIMNICDICECQLTQ